MNRPTPRAPRAALLLFALLLHARAAPGFPPTASITFPSTRALWTASAGGRPSASWSPFDPVRSNPALPGMHGSTGMGPASAHAARAGGRRQGLERLPAGAFAVTCGLRGRVGR